MRARAGSAGPLPAARTMAAIAVAAVLAAASSRALRNEDVVRLVVHGTSEAAVIDYIDSATPAFDLAPDVVVELRAVGVSEPIIAAMRRRQAEAGAAAPGRMAPAAGASAAPAAPSPTGTITLTIAPSGDGREARPLLAPGGEPPWIVRRAAARAGVADAARPVSEMALAILCTTTDHVPDHWDTKTPLRDGPRHEILLFQPATGKTKVRGTEALYLDLAGPYPVTVAAGNHALRVVAAGRDAGTGAWRILASAEARVAVPAAGDAPLTLTARSGVEGGAPGPAGSAWGLSAGGAAPEAAP